MKIENLMSRDGCYTLGKLIFKFDGFRPQDRLFACFYKKGREQVFLFNKVLYFEQHGG